MGIVAEVVAGGDEQASLTALRDRLAQAIDDAEPRELPGLAKQLTDVLARLAAFVVEEGSELDDLAARREQRRAEVSKRPKGTKLGGTGSS